jgi:hypothetical protein
VIDLFNYAKRDRYLVSDEAWVEDRTYHIGEISQTTGLRKCFVNGNIVWLDPSQGHDFLNSKMPKQTEINLAKSAKSARADGTINLNGNIKTEAAKYLKYMKNSWNKNPAKVRHLHDVKVKLNSFSNFHFYHGKNGKPRTKKEIAERAACLPYVRDILERSGKPADHRVNPKTKEESYTIVGNANINNKKQEIAVVITKQPNGYFYLSTFQLR